MIERDFGTWNAFQRTFHAHASAMIGCGWVWLVSSASENKLSIQTTFNGASPLFKSSSNDPETPSNCSVSSVINSPILGLNLWESAFTLDYSLDRDLYVTNWWSAINWNRAAVLLSR
jgi:superoxide dismutase, Fe-Mn family